MKSYVIAVMAFICSAGRGHTLVKPRAMASQLYEIEPVKAEDTDAIMDLLRRTFYIDEPMNKALGLYDSGSVPELDKYCSGSLNEGLSFKAVDPQGNIVGVIISGVVPLSKHSAKDMLKAAQSCTNDKFRKILYVLSKREEGHKLWEKYPDDKTTVEVKVAATDPAWRKKGIMNKLLEQTEQLLKQKHIKLLRMDTSSAYSAYAAERYGFTCVYSAKYTDIKLNGEPLVLPEEPHTEDRVYIKCLF